MPKTRATLMVDAGVLRAVRMEATRTGKPESEVIEEALRRDLGLDAGEELWSRVKNPPSERESMNLAYEQLHEMRRERRAAGSP